MSATNKRTVVTGKGCLTCNPLECEKHILHITPTGPHASNVTEINKGSKHCKKLQIKKWKFWAAEEENEDALHLRGHTDLGWLGSGASRNRAAGPGGVRSSGWRAQSARPSARRCSRQPRSACPHPDSRLAELEWHPHHGQPPQVVAGTEWGTSTARRERTGTPWLLLAPLSWRCLLWTGRGRIHGHLPLQCPPFPPCWIWRALLGWNFACWVKISWSWFASWCLAEELRKADKKQTPSILVWIWLVSGYYQAPVSSSLL